jgi:hypothetical protein
MLTFICNSQHALSQKKERKKEQQHDCFQSEKTEDLFLHNIYSTKNPKNEILEYYISSSALVLI